MSISPAAQRQLRSKIRRPHDSRYSAAACSPDLPSTSLARIAITSGSDDRRNQGRPAGVVSGLWKAGKMLRAGGNLTGNVSARWSNPAGAPGTRALVAAPRGDHETAEKRKGGRKT